MTVLTPKRPEETILYTLDLLQELRGDIIATFTLEVTSGTISTAGPPVPANIGVGVAVLISGGVDGETAALTLTATTFAKQVIERDYTLQIAAGVTAIVPSTAPKGFLCKRAFESMGLSPYEFDPTSEEYLTALDTLDALMAELAVNDLDLGYNAPLVMGGSNLDDESGIPDFAVNFVGRKLGEAVAPSIGKSLSREAVLLLVRAEAAVRARWSVVLERPLPRKTPLGAGGKPWTVWWPFAGSGDNSAGG